tara:strand:- start:493 stop:663 length:171 start_codon:yes stop_codon:yes gene_type:complete
MKKFKKDNKDTPPSKGELKPNLQPDEIKKSAKKLFGSLVMNKEARSGAPGSAKESD